MIRTMLVVVLVLSPQVLHAQEDASRVFGRCAGCHGMPDPGVPGDRDWIRRVSSTACVQPPGPKSLPTRKALMKWLQDAASPRPPVVRRRKDPEADEGLVRSNVGRGSILLVPEGGAGGVADQVRLVFSGEQGDAALRAVEEGTWTVRGYRVHRKDAKGRSWQLWGAGSNGRTVRIRRGETVSLDLDLAVTVKPMAHPARGKLRVGLGVTGDSGMGATVVRAGDRVPAAYTLMRGDRKLASGPLAYG